MPVRSQRLALVKYILNDETIAAEEEAILIALLKEQVSQDAISLHEGSATFGQKAADVLARFAGSWSFICIFFALLLGWVILNTLILVRPYDAYPFILLNLILSCLAAIQAPVIMMSQNRQEHKDRLRAKNDYKVNLKSEIIIEAIHEKLDLIIENQQKQDARINAVEKQIDKG